MNPYSPPQETSDLIRHSNSTSTAEKVRDIVTVVLLLGLILIPSLAVTGFWPVGLINVGAVAFIFAVMIYRRHFAR